MSYLYTLSLKEVSKAKQKVEKLNEKEKTGPNIVKLNSVSVFLS